VSADGQALAAIYINFDINEGLVNMAKEKKKSKGPKDRNSNYQMENGNAVSRKKEKRPAAAASAHSRAEQPRGLLSGISCSISSATSSIGKMLKH